MRITIELGSDHELTQEQFDSLNTKMQELADNDNVEFVMEDHSTRDGGDYYLIFKDDIGMELKAFAWLISDIHISIKTCLGAEFNDWWASYE